MTDNTLKLNFNGNNLTSTNGGVSEVEWISGNDKYNVEINVADGTQYSYFHIILSDKTNLEVIELRVGTRTNNTFKAAFYAPRVLKNNERINIGVIAKVMNATEVVVSNAFPILIKNGIAPPTGFTYEGEDINNSGFATLLNLFQGGKVIKDLELILKTENGIKKPYLVFKYADDSEDQGKQEFGPLSADLIELGAIIDRKNGTGGGGKLGVDAELRADKEGFAGGYKASVGGGAAVGAETFETSGVAIGLGAKSQVNSKNKFYDGIAIGYNTIVDKDSVSSTAIGDRSQIIKSPRSIVIGGVTNTDNNRTSIISNSERSIGIGYNVKVFDMSDSIIIGTEAKGEGRNTSKEQNAIAIGHLAKSGLSGAIAIGPNAKAAFGANENSGILTGNQTDEKKGDGFGGIAIGQNAYSRRSCAIALGKNSDALRWGAVAIGYGSKAGTQSSDSELELDKNGDSTSDTAGYCAVAIGASSTATGRNSVAIGNTTKATDTSSVAIGTEAIATAGAAIQLGAGTNNKGKSLQFRNKTIVIDDKLQVELEKDNLSGILPIAKGGTGANDSQNAQKKLGIYTGGAKVELPKSKASDDTSKKVKEITIYYKDKNTKIFSEKPSVTFSLQSSVANAVYEYGAMITEITETYFKIKVGAPSLKDKKIIKINWIAVGKR